VKNKIVLLLAILSSAGVASISGRVPSDAPVEARIPFAPIPAKINGQTIIAYELHLTNLIARELTLNRIEVFRQDTRSTPIVSYQNDNLLTLIVQPGNPSTTIDKRKIAGGSVPEVFATDRGFDNAGNQKICSKARIGCASIPQRGGKKTAERQAFEKSPDFKKAQRFRAGIEGRISVLFRGRGMKRCLARGKERFRAFIGVAVLANNLMKIAELLIRRDSKKKPRSRAA